MEWLFLSVVVAANPTVALEVGPHTACIDATRLENRLQAQGVSRESGSANRVHISQKGGAVVLDGWAHGRGLQRTVPISGADCEALERVVATLIGAWVKTQLLVETPSAPAEVPVAQTSRPVVPAPPPRAEPSHPVLEPSGPPVVVAPELAPSPAESVVARQESTPDIPTVAAPTVGVAKDAVPKDAVAKDAVRTVAQPPPASVPSPPERPSDPEPNPSPPDFHVSTSLLGGLAVGPTPDVVGSGALVLGAWWRHYGLLLDGGFQSARTQSLSGAELSASFQWLTLSARAGLVLGGFDLEVGLGVRLTRLTATATHVEVATPRVLWALGGGASVAARRRLTGPLCVELRLLGGLRSQAERLTVDGATSSLNLDVLEFQALLGVAGLFDL